MISVFFCCILIFIVFAPKMRALSERLNVVSLSGFLAIRYKSNQFRLLCGTLVSVMMVPYAISAMKGIADAMHAIVGIPYAMGAVSYTHLDVYKRQIWNVVYRKSQLLVNIN